MTRFLSLFKIVFSLISLCLFYGFLIEPKLLKIREVSYTLPQYGGPSLRIVLLSDIHIGGLHVPPERVEKLVKRINQLQPDIVLIAGDFISGHTPRKNQSADFNAEIDTGVAFLSGLQASKGVYATMGNHDVWYEVDYVRDTLLKNDITVLQNQVEHLADDLCLVGLTDYETQERSFSVSGACKTGTTKVAFMHSPDSFKFLSSDTALAFAGHTHGGQINIPLIGRRITSTSAGQKYAYGKLDIAGIPAFVTAGIGTSILPARFRAPPEIVLVTFRPPH